MKLAGLIIPPERCTVLITFSLDQYMSAKNTLAASGIGHRSLMKASARELGQRAGTGGSGIKQKYEIRVRPEDEERALAALRSSRGRND
ncbi:hypothetical protein F4V43_02915 [Paenibacillus spiritus]|uniref:Uncharacterized protein n=1 Tax=Paenibacillus spiritus TaxID=2496557 RepID=A0A5J5GGX2_9BACL|nr:MULTISPECIES: hypothetical protein [Paenibacillus]KAA9007456.1 hypothetical protein F4V43_02915 [Paenibacillus spiritus]